MQFKIAAFYEFNQVSDLKFLSKELNLLCKNNKLQGTIIIASEGINGTVAGLPNLIDEFVKHLDHIGFYKLNIKYSYTAIMPFTGAK